MAFALRLRKVFSVAGIRPIIKVSLIPLQPSLRPVAAPPDISYFIFSMFSLGFIKYRRCQKVIAFPIIVIVIKIFLIFIMFKYYVKRGGSIAAFRNADPTFPSLISLYLF